MVERETVPEADALEQALPPSDVRRLHQAPVDPTDPDDLLEIDDDPEIGVEVPEADAMEQGRSRAVPAAVANRPIPVDAAEHDVLEQRLPATHEDDDDDFR